MMKDNSKRDLEQNKILSKAEKLSNTLLNKALLYSIENIKEKNKDNKSSK